MQFYILIVNFRMIIYTKDKSNNNINKMKILFKIHFKIDVDEEKNNKIYVLNKKNLRVEKFIYLM